MTITTITDHQVRTELPAAMLDRFRARAGDLDRDNAYFDEDLAELRDAGYLAAAVPIERGGWGLSLADLAASQRRLARYAPATALAMSMHSYWVGIAVELEKGGDTSLRWILDEAAAGRLFAAGHAEPGNDIPVLLSTCQAERVAGGYRLSGRKQFGSNGPAWTWLGAHALVADAPGGPQVVHAFVERTSPGVSVVETWDTLGMRATQSHDTVLDEVFVPDARIGRVVPAGDASDPFIVAMAMWPLSLIGAVYLGIADRALELAVTGARRKTSMAIERGAYAYNPMVQHQVAEMFLELDAAPPPPSTGSSTTGWRASTTARRGCRRCIRRSGGRSRRPSGSWTSPSTWSAAPACSRATSSSGSTATSAAAASTPATTHSPTSWWEVGARHPRRAAPLVTPPALAGPAHHRARSACSTAASPSSAAPSRRAAS